jgi:predicted O-methyltransferase YrrM
MANGLSTLFIASALSENKTGRHFAIDPYQSTDWRDAGRVAVRRAGFESIVEVIEKPSHQALPELEQSGISAQFVFVDGSHMFDYVMADFVGSDRILEVGGLLAFDDSDWPAITQVIRYILANREYKVAFSDVVIEPSRIAPSLSSRLLRVLAKALPQLRKRMRVDFITPSHVLGVKGRCVVLQKGALDERDSQSRYHMAF